MKIAVLLATYNGEKYIAEQLDSLLNQTNKNFVIYISDDCSNDNTIEIVKVYENNHPDRIKKLDNIERFGSAKENFLHLLLRVEADLYFFCDQDDVWLSDKIESLLLRYNQEENKNQPISLYSDSIVVDSNLKTLYGSFVEYLGFYSTHDSWKFHLIHNDAAGCTMLINKKLADLYKENSHIIDSKKIMMHDYFFIQMASIFGKVVFLDKKLMLYRQHENNSVGIKTNHVFPAGKTLHIDNIEKTCDQLMEIFKIPFDIDKNRKEFVEKYARLKYKSDFYRINFLLFHGMIYPERLKNKLGFIFELINNQNKLNEYYSL